MNKKKNGSFYTNDKLAKFVTDWLLPKIISKHNISILEPSAGDGKFIDALKTNTKWDKLLSEIYVVEKNRKELDKIILKYSDILATCEDFLIYQANDIRKKDLVIGNPPYIKKNYLTKTQKETCSEIHTSNNLSVLKIKNIWSAFLVRCINYLKDDGILAFILPAELLQVKFAVELREFIKKEFERIEIFTFDELLFEDCKGQDTVLLIGEKKSDNKGVFFANIKNIEDLKPEKIQLKKNNSIETNDTKWTHHLISSDNLEFVYKVKKDLKLMKDYCDSKPGIVTAANDYFIVNNQTLKEFKLKDYAEEIIQKGFFVNGSVVFDKKNFKKLKDDNKPAFLLNFNGANPIKDEDLKKYLEKGLERKLQKRYKCSIRKNWYEIPNISTPSEGFFFKRSHEYPKLLKNNDKFHVTDSAYKIDMKENFKINDLIFSFYNSFTLLFAELEGRYYGGGVLELTPSEFKKLPITIEQVEKFSEFVERFEKKKSIDEISHSTDKIILAKVLKLNSEEIQRVQSIKSLLYNRRIRNN
ncbi:MAG: N-6 DNA methylase [Bacteroidetes bacterium]|nr:N-6 DNA methylase [Bacteroidota bacterium]